MLTEFRTVLFKKSLLLNGQFYLVEVSYDAEDAFLVVFDIHSAENFLLSYPHVYFERLYRIADRDYEHLISFLKIKDGKLKLDIKRLTATSKVLKAEIKEVEARHEETFEESEPPLPK